MVAINAALKRARFRPSVLIHVLVFMLPAIQAVGLIRRVGADVLNLKNEVLPAVRTLVFVGRALLPFFIRIADLFFAVRAFKVHRFLRCSHRA